MADPRMMKLIQDMMAKKQASGAVVPETDDSANMALQSPADQEYETPEDVSQAATQAGRGSDQMISGSPRNSYKTSPDIEALLKQLGQNQPQAEEAEVAPESIDMKKAALEKIKQKYLGR